MFIGLNVRSFLSTSPHRALHHISSNSSCLGYSIKIAFRRQHKKKICKMMGIFRLLFLKWKQYKGGGGTKHININLHAHTRIHTHAHTYSDTCLSVDFSMFDIRLKIVKSKVIKSMLCRDGIYVWVWAIQYLLEAIWRKTCCNAKYYRWDYLQNVRKI